MPQSFNETVKNTFIQGLITERNELTFPENASTDEDNCDLLKDGSRRRRLGLVQETNGVLSDTTATTGNTVFTVHRWENVGEVEGLEYIVVQMGNIVDFYQQSSSTLSVNNLSDADPLFRLNLTLRERPASTTGAGSAPIQVASIKGRLVVASPEINTTLVKYTASGFTVEEIAFKVRDYGWQGDISTYSTISGTTPSVARQYDTKNTGWSDGPNGVGDSALSTYSSAKSGAYPPLTHPWYSGKDASGNFSVAEWEKVYAGTTLAANGHYILDLYNKDRDTASGLSGVPAGLEDARFSTVAGYAGRVFYSGMTNSTDDNSSKIFFSKVLEEGFSEVGTCHQINDPTSEDFSDLLDTDGGFIVIPEAYNIKKLHNFGPDLYVFADNGVWRISGVDDVFRATEYSVSKLSEDGIIEAESFVSANGRPYWWSYNGIYTVVSNEGGGITTQNLSVSTIQTFFNNISLANRGRVRGGYDEVERRVIWAYPAEDESNDNKLNKFLLFDEVLGAFIPWTISDSTPTTSYPVAVAFSNGQGTSTVTYNVIDGNGDNVVDGSGNNVTIQRTGRSLSSSRIKILYRDTTGAVSFAEFIGQDFLDWGDADYSSYAETAYDFLGSMMSKKNAPYILSVLKVTETGWENTGSGFVPIRESSCQVRAKWDFKTTYSSSAQEAYRLKFTPVVNPSDLSSFGYPYTAVQTRLKVRGTGRVMQLRWESTTGKDFHLLGWAVLGANNGRV